MKYNLYMDLSACFQSPYKSDFSAYEILTIKINQNTNYILLDGDCNSLKIDSIKGPLKSIKHTDNKLSLYTLKDFKANDTLKIIIYYKYKNTDYSSFKCYNGQVYTDDIPDGAATWFFCLDKPNEKAYTDISVKVPFNVRLCSVGKMIMYNQNSGYAYYRWVSEYPVSTYIIALVASNDYNVKLYWWKSKNNPSDSLEVKLYWNNNIDEKYCIELIFKMLDFYTNLFGKIHHSNGVVFQINR
ncbi:MAG: hypothetical protein NTU73_15100 [Ignavibacteriae bacterium]|nr:hypothetical protein [Ignavibacteriota bacterium]